MRLDLNAIKAVSWGAVRIGEENGYRFYRYTKEQEEVYAKHHPEFMDKVYSTSGICMEFVTDSRSLTLDVDTAPSTTRKFYAFDVFRDGVKVGELANVTPHDALFGTEFILGNARKQFDLGGGVKTVKLQFPWSVTAKVNEISLDDGSFVNPAAAKAKMLCFGDSITQGYDARYPSLSYVSRLADLLDVEVVNKAIGGEVFFPELAQCREDFEPKYITVAYGTNDWTGREYTDFRDRCFRFYAALAKHYPQAKIFAITPIWRRDENEEKPMGKFETVRNTILEAVREYENIIPIDGYDFVPHDGEAYFSDLRLHPNDQGFRHYAEKLYGAMKQYL